MTRKLLMISTDRKIFEVGSAVRARQVDYARDWDEVHIIVFAGSGIPEQSIAPNAWVYPTKSLSKIMYPLDAIRLGRFIVGARGITEITCQDASFTAMVGISLKKEFNIPLEIQIHDDIGSPYYTYTLLQRFRKMLALSYLPKADRIRVASKRIRDYLITHLKVDVAKIIVRPIHVDVSVIREHPVAPDNSLQHIFPTASKIVLMASRLEREKNIDVALRAWKQIIALMPEAQLVIVGSGSQLSRLKKLAFIDLKLGDSAAFMGWKDRATLFSYYKTADVFLNLSLFEGYGMTLVEAQAAGCVVVSTDVGVAPDIGARIVEPTIKSVVDTLVTILK